MSRRRREEQAVSRFALVVLVLGSLAFGIGRAQQPAYFVVADLVRGAEGAMGAVCVINSVFYPGEQIIFRSVVVDAATGEELRHEAIETLGLHATVVIDGVAEFDMFYPPVDDTMPPDLYFYRGPWVVPAELPMGEYRWNVIVSDAAGNEVTFAPIGQGVGLSSITILAQN
jgi:hypothetical protein